MDRTTKTERPSDRRAADRRERQRVFPGGDKRAVVRRSVSDRRTSPRD